MTIIFTFFLFLLFFVIIGVSSIRKRNKTTADYLVADHSVPAWLVGLSAVATNNSGYMFIGIIGFAYSTGIFVLWLMIAWVIGDFIASLLLHRKIREKTSENNLTTFGGLLASWNKTDFKYVRVISGILTVIFLGTYAAAQLNAGSKALSVLFGWDYYIGAVIGATIVLLYCFSGGIRASIWTDAAQAIVMAVSMLILLYTSIDSIGGLDQTIVKLNSVSETFMSHFPEGELFGAYLGPGLLLLSWIFGGMAAVAQPHIVVRYMAIDDPKKIYIARWFYYSFFLIFAVMSVVVGLLSRILIPVESTFDPELALPTLGYKFLPDPLIGLILAGLFAATMSTADSLILSCSAAVSRDIFPQKKNHYLLTKVSTVVVTLAALFVALYGEKSVFRLVMASWSVLGCAFMPLLLVYALNKKPNQLISVVMLIAGPLFVWCWREAGLASAIYEVMPATIFSLILYFSWSSLKKSSKFKKS